MGPSGVAPVDAVGPSDGLALAVASSTRGLIEGLPSPRPIRIELPAVYQEDEFCRRLTSAFDDVLAPVFATLDCFDSYLDAELAPDDFVGWLAGWVGVDIDEPWTPEQRRRLVHEAAALYRIRGTAGGLAAHLRSYAEVTPEIEESGGCEWSETANASLPGSAEPYLTVRLEVDDPAALRRTTVERIIGTARPAHLPFELHIATAANRPAEATSPNGANSERDGTPTADGAIGAVNLPGSQRIELAPPGLQAYEDLVEGPSAPEGEQLDLPGSPMVETATPGLGNEDDLGAAPSPYKAEGEEPSE